MRAHLVLKGPGGTLPGPESLSSENIEDYRADTVSIEKVRQWLHRNGVEVRSFGPFSVSVEIEPQKLENLFQGTLAPLSERTSSGMSWAKQPTIPHEISDIVDTIAIPKPIRIDNK